MLAYPTETVYGFGGAIDRDSVDALVALKGRPPGKPFLLLIAGSEMLERLDLQPAELRDATSRRGTGPARSRSCCPAASGACPSAARAGGRHRRPVDVASRRFSG